MKKKEIIETLNSIEILEYGTNETGDLTFLFVEYTDETFDKITSLGLNATVLMNEFVELDLNTKEYVIDLNKFVWRLCSTWDNESGFK